MSLQKRKIIQKFSKENILEKLQIKSLKTLLLTVLYSFIVVVIYFFLSLLPKPFTMVELLKLGIIPALALIPMLGAIRGPLAGFIAGYIGPLLVDLILFQTVLAFTIPYLPFGILGFLVGLAQYKLNNGKSLAKLAILSTIVYLFSIILLTVIALTIQKISLLVVLVYVILPQLTMGIPSVFLLTPLYCRLWHIVLNDAYPSVKNLLIKLKSRTD